MCVKDIYDDRLEMVLFSQSPAWLMTDVFPLEQYVLFSHPRA